MKKLLFLGLVLLAFCSCGKNYPQMVKDKAEQYKKEGKIILNQSNDSIGKEHYVVYADVKEQVIGVDTLGEKVKEVKLGKKKSNMLSLLVEEGRGLVAEFNEDLASSPEFKLQADGQLLVDDLPASINVYKDKYILVKGSGYRDFISNVIFLNGVGDATFCEIFENVAIDDFGNLNVVLRSSLDMILPNSWSDFIADPYGHPDLFIERDCGRLSCKATVSPDGKIINQSDIVVCDGVRIPTEAFSSWDILTSYISEISNKWNRIFQAEKGLR